MVVADFLAMVVLTSTNFMTKSCYMT